MTKSGFDNIAYVDDLSAIKSSINQADIDNLIIFDVGHVIIMPTDEYTYRNSLRKSLLNQLQRNKSPEYIRTIYGITADKTEWQLVDPQIMQILKIIEQKNLPAIALTSLHTGQFGKITKFEDWRISQLQKFNIDFNNFTPFSKQLVMTHLAKQGGTPLYKEGIIFAAQIDKAEILKQVLEHYNYYPKKIIFIDDKFINIKQVAILCKALDIQYQGFVYQAVSKMPIPQVHRQKEIIRFEILKNSKQWLSYKELEDRLSNFY